MEDTHPDVAHLAIETGRFCNRWFCGDEKNRLLVLVGGTGCGKTHVAKRIARWVSAVSYERWLHLGSGDALPEVAFVDWCHVATPQRTSEDRFYDWLTEHAEDSMLILDDVGTEVDAARSGAPTARLCTVLNQRAGKFTLITTNVPVASWAARWDARVEDRLLRGSVVIENTAPSFTTSHP